MIKLGSNNIGKIYLGSNSIGKAYLGSNLVYQKGGGLPYTPVSYIETDGVAYIDTGIVGADAKSCEIKCVLVNTGDIMLGCSTGSEDNYNFVLLHASLSSTAGFAHYYYYAAGLPSIADSLSNETPFIAKTSLAQGSQSISVKQEGESSYTTATKTQSTAINTGRTMFLFGANGGGTHCSLGSKVYYCKIYNDATFTNLVRDFVPCLYQGEYGMWDRVSNSFFGNAASSGAFSGPSNS